MRLVRRSMALRNSRPRHHICHMATDDKPGPAAPAPKPAPPVPPQAEPREIGGPKGPEPTRHGDWEFNGRCTDF
jgi:hypothetical protein